MVEVFYDRRGKEKYADDVIPFEQKGYFAILVKDDRVLVTYPLSLIHISEPTRPY